LARIQSIENNAYNQKPSKGGRKVNAGKNGKDGSDNEEEDVVYFNK